jgi:hypothetical protein
VNSFGTIKQEAKNADGDSYDKVVSTFVFESSDTFIGVFFGFGSG